MRKFSLTPLISLFTLSLVFLLSACTDKPLSPKQVAEQFWQAAEQGHMDAAKQMVSWDTAGYLKYINDEKFKLKRVELGEADIQENVATFDTTLILQRKQGDDFRLPSRTVVIKTEGLWRVQLKQTMTAVLERSMNEAANQFNQLLREGMQELSKSLSGSVEEISKSLEQGAKELSGALEGNAKKFGESVEKFQQELEKSLPKPEKKTVPPSRKEI